jgi:hypothetical protein
MVNAGVNLPHNYISTVNPTIDVNPPILNMTWLNSTTGEIFVCLDTTIDGNFWNGMLGTRINAPYSLPHGEILTSFASPSIYPYGLAFDGTNLISCDTGSDRIYVHKRADEI